MIVDNEKFYDNINMQARVVRIFFLNLITQFLSYFIRLKLKNNIYYQLNVTDGHVHSLNMVDETSALPGYTHKIVDLEEADKETMHLLVFLLMQFLSRQDQVNKLFFNSNSLFLHKKQYCPGLSNG